MDEPPEYKKDLFYDLPLELKAKILSYLPFKDSIRLITTSHYFNEAIKYSLKDIIIPYDNLHDYNSILPLINHITDNNLLPIKHIIYNNKSDSDNETPESICKVLSNFTVNALTLASYDKSILTTIKRIGPFPNLHKLCLNAFTEKAPFNINDFEVLTRFTPNLKVLEFEVYHYTLHLYKGLSYFNNLICLKLSTEYFNRNITILDQVTSSFLQVTPKLKELAIDVVDLENVREAIGQLDNLEYLGLIFGTEFMRPVSEIVNRSIKGMYVNGWFYNPFPNVPPSEENSLNNLEIFFFVGKGCINVMDYYSIGGKLKNLFVSDSHTIGVVDSSNVITTICKLCPNLEHLGLQYLDIPISWLVKLSTEYCKELRWIQFGSLVIDENLEELKKVKIKNMHIYNKLDKDVLDWLTENGFNIYKHLTFISYEYFADIIRHS